MRLHNHIRLYISRNSIKFVGYIYVTMIWVMIRVKVKSNIRIRGAMVARLTGCVFDSRRVQIPRTLIPDNFLKKFVGYFQLCPLLSDSTHYYFEGAEWDFSQQLRCIGGSERIDQSGMSIETVNRDWSIETVNRDWIWFPDSMITKDIWTNNQPCKYLRNHFVKHWFWLLLPS